MTAIWPATLPQFVQERGYTESLADLTVESQVDSGPSRSRRRFTKQFRPVQCEIWCLSEQVPIFEHFYETTLEAGTLPFHWVNPISQQLAQFRFKRPPPAYTSFGSANVAIQFSLWQLTLYAALRFDSTLITFDSTLRTFDEANRF